MNAQLLFPLGARGTAFAAVLRSIKPSMLATTIFDLSLNGKMEKAIVKDIQYDRISYRVIHLDFEALSADTTVNLNVPVICTGSC